MRNRGPPCGPVLGAALEQVCSNGSQNAAPFFEQHATASAVLAEVRGVWQWWNCLEEQVSSPKKVLRVNVDETAVRFYMPQPAGLVAKKRRRRCGPEPTQDASRRQQRSCVTHVAAICDDTAVQAVLPQVFVGNEAVLQVSWTKLLRPALRKNVILLRRKSGWVNKDFLVTYVKLLAVCLEPFASVYQPILLWDALPAHCAPMVLRAAARAGLWVVIVPAKLTWLLQPLDTDVFSRYKHYLRQRYLQLLCDSADGRVAAVSVILAMNDACREVLQSTAWAAVFLRNGFGAAQRLVKHSIREECEVEEVASAGSGLPTLAQLAAIFPNRLDVPINDLFYPFIPRPPALSRGPREAAAPAPTAGVTPWAERLRQRGSSSALGFEAGASSSSAAAAPPPDAALPPPETADASSPAQGAYIPRGYKLPGLRRPASSGEAAP